MDKTAKLPILSEPTIMTHPIKKCLNRKWRYFRRLLYSAKNKGCSRESGWTGPCNKTKNLRLHRSDKSAKRDISAEVGGRFSFRAVRDENEIFYFTASFKLFSLLHIYFFINLARISRFFDTTKLIFPLITELEKNFLLQLRSFKFPSRFCVRYFFNILYNN